VLKLINMRLLLFLAALTGISAVHAQESGKPGYNCQPKCITPTISENKSFNFGRHYAVLNLDMISGIVGAVNSTAAGQQFITNTAKWIDAVHAQDPTPLSIFTRVYFSNSHLPEIGPQSPFGAVASSLGTKSNPLTELYPAFRVDREAGDVVLQKTRYYAGAGNALEEILSTQGIDTVILSGLRTSGVITATAYRLFDLDYKV
jgi:nicotinamidase-related amidase